jgi:hypothetical protein
VCMLSGNVVGLAMAGSGLRMPAIGIVPANTAQSAVAKVYALGEHRVTSGLDALWSGMAGKTLFAGSGGAICTFSGLLSGMSYQRIAVATSGGLYLGVSFNVTSGAVATPAGNF